MKKTHLFLLGFGGVYLLVVAFLISGLSDLSWKNSHSYYIAFMIGLMIIYNAIKSLNKLKRKSFLV